MAIDKAKWAVTVSDAQKALVRVRDAEGKLTDADSKALGLLASESRSIGAELTKGVASQSAAVPNESYLRDAQIVVLCGTTWNLADQWGRNIGKSLAIEPDAVAHEATATNGLWWLAALCDEIVARPTRKTVDTAAPGSGFTEKKPTGGTLEERLIRIEDKIDTLLTKK